MESTKIRGVFKEKNKLFTENPSNCKGLKVYNEKLINYKNKQYRSWNPYRSKLSAAITNGLKTELKTDLNILYLGAATGTTVSHFSDILKDGIIYSIENSPIALKKLIQVSEKRTNVVPVLADANHPDRYNHIVSSVDLVYQDISQRNQAEIFIKNVKSYLKKKGLGIFMVKARSIDVSLKPKKAFEQVASQLRENDLKIIDMVDLSPYEKDHAAILVST
jgi:fibrillarin-like pre-rRNA processing protein